MISLVIPTYNEAVAIEQTVRRSARALAGTGEEFEIIVVDDASADGTANICERLGRELSVRVVRRSGRLGLATAVVEGWRAARGDVWGVMDADLQHPPEVLGTLVEALRTQSADLVIASRYVKGGGSEDWTWARRLVSRTATRLAGCALPWTLADVSDPMSGMFLVRASALDGIELKPTGYKILLEVLARGRCGKVAEVPYVFRRRTSGSSKLATRQYLEYLEHVARLAGSTGQQAAWFRYIGAGLIAAMVYVGALYFGAMRAGMPWALLVPAGVQLGMLMSFFLHQKLTFATFLNREKVSGKTLFRLLDYEKACWSGAATNIAVVMVLLNRGVNPFAALGVGLVAGGCWNALINARAIWRIWRPLAGGYAAPAQR